MPVDVMPINGDTMPFTQAVRDALWDEMIADESVFVIGEGVPDPKAIFETTRGLRSEFGAQRVLDMPIAENALTGLCIGAASHGLKPVLIHQRIDFALLSLDQLINNAAKWHYMFNGLQSVPLTVRMIVGRGWGQGPQHSQALHQLFAHIPGLKVFLPVTPQQAYDQLRTAIQDPNPCIVIEHRWTQWVVGEVSKCSTNCCDSVVTHHHHGNQLTLVTASYPTLEAIAVAKVLATVGVDVDVLQITQGHDWDQKKINASVSRTGRLLCVDMGHEQQNFMSHVMQKTQHACFAQLKQPMQLMAMPNHPVPTSHHLANDTYFTPQQMATKILDMVGQTALLPQVLAQLPIPEKADSPNPAFKGPF